MLQRAKELGDLILEVIAAMRTKEDLQVVSTVVEIGTISLRVLFNCRLNAKRLDIRVTELALAFAQGPSTPSDVAARQPLRGDIRSELRWVRWTDDGWKMVERTVGPVWEEDRLTLWTGPRRAVTKLFEAACKGEGKMAILKKRVDAEWVVGFAHKLHFVYN